MNNLNYNFIKTLKNPFFPNLIILQIYGCENSGLFTAFSEHILHRLKIPVHEKSNPKVRVTLLSRDTQYRKILNEDELVAALEKNPDYEVKKVIIPEYFKLD